jgi:putative selenate reductase
LASGVVLHDIYKVNQENFEKLLNNYDGLFLGAGAQRSAMIDLEGIGAKGVLDPLKFLFGVRSGNHLFEGRHVVIIGGGNTAMDAARTALRLVGKEGSVKIVYRRTIKEMPADQGEIRAVFAEGGMLMELIRPVSVGQPEGRVTGLRCRKTVLSVAGKDGRPVPVDVPDSEFEIPCDTIIPAIGQKLAFDFLPKEALKVVSGSYGTRNPKLFIGGDALRGASTAINAIADGRKAAMEMLAANRLPVNCVTTRVFSEPVQDNLQVKKASRIYSEVNSEDAVADSLNFNLLHRKLSSGQAMREAARCLECDRICNVCVSVCPNLANFGYEIDPVTYHMQKAVKKEDGSIAFEPGELFTIDQPFQVLNIRDFCNECGNCTTFCPSSGRPFKDKPGLHLNVSSLNEEGTGFFLSRLPDRNILIFKEQNHIRTIFVRDGLYYYETDQVKAVLNPDFTLSEVQFLTPCVKEFHFTFAAEMSIVLEGALRLIS